MEKRKNPRVVMQKVSADVSDGSGCFSGTVSDISRSGICIVDLSKRLNRNVKKLTVVVSSERAHFKMSIWPKWSVQEGIMTSFGAEIASIPDGWTAFVMRVEPAFHGGVWGEIRL